MLVEDVMSRSLKTVNPDTPLAEVVSMMCLYRLSGIPVVEDDNKLVGFISERDVLSTEKHDEDKALSHDTAY
mgnify:CR=1 FL=1